MRYFEVMVEGDRYISSSAEDSGSKYIGFFITKYVAAENETAAETIALKMIDNDSELSSRSVFKSDYSTLVVSIGVRVKTKSLR